MIFLTPAQKRAEEFAALVDHRDGTFSDAANRHTELLELVGAMREVGTPEPRPDFVSDLRERLLVEADTALSPTQRKLVLEKKHPTRHRDRRLAVLAGTIAAIGATSSVAMASQGALPGDTLYPIKRAIEGAQTSLTVNDSAKAESMLENADGRLSEVEKLARQLNTSNTAALPDTLAAFSDQASHAADLTIESYEEKADPAPMVELRNFAANAMDRLGNLEALMPSTAIGPLNRAVETLLSIDSRVTSICPDCEGTLLELPTRLLLSLRAADATPQVAPKPVVPLASPSALPSDVPSTDPTQADQVVGSHVIDIDELERLLAQGNPDGSDTKPNPTSRERAEKAAQALVDVLNSGGEALLGDKGLLGPVLSPLDPVLDPLLGPLLGKGGLLNP